MLTAFICAAAMLTACAAAMIVKLSGSVNALMTAAAAPDIMQMHSGKIDLGRLEGFAKENPLVKDYQTLSFLNIDGGNILLGDADLSGSVQDNGICAQSKKFDFLIGNDGEILRPKNGEIFLPLCYMNDAAIGDDIYICGKRFAVAGFLRDAQMESSFASSKRFLVSQSDYEALKSEGSEEYLIEFLLKDRGTAGELEAAYAAAGLEANGPAVSYALFKLMNSLSGGILAGAVILLSILIIGIAFLCIRFTLLAKLEEDSRQIGVMRALGLSRRDVTSIYLGKYALISAVGCLLGTFISIPAKSLLINNMSLYMSADGDELLAGVFALTGAALLFLAVTAYVKRVLKRVFRASIPEAMRGAENEGCRIGLSLGRLSGLGANLSLGLNDLLSRKKLYLTMLIVLILASFMVIVPQNLYATVSSDSFIGYMGSGICDMRIDLQQADDIGEKAKQIESMLASDPEIEKYAVYTTGNYELCMTDGSRENISIDLGSHELFPARYSKGRAPQGENEVALSALEAKELEKNAGDTIRIIAGGKERTLTVSGVYSDITNGGKTAKADFSAEAENVMRYMFSADIKDGGEKERIEAYKAELDYAKVSDIEKYVAQTLGGSISAMRTASRVSLAAALFVCALITALFIKMLTVRDERSNAVLRALGFSRSDIRNQYLWRVFIVALFGFALGAVLANTLGQSIAGRLISSMGASGMRFVIEPLRSYLLCPALLTGTALASACLGLALAGDDDLHNALGVE